MPSFRTRPSHGDRFARAVTGVFWSAALFAHAAGAVVGFALLPGGFPLLHGRCYANRLFPALIVLSVAAALALRIRRSRMLAAALGIFPGLWLGAALSAAVAFPESGGSVAIVAAVVALVLSLAVAARCLRQGWSWLVACCSLAAVLAGAGFVLAQRAPAPSTHPFTEALSGERPQDSPGRYTFLAGGVSIVVSPRLEFGSRSPDGFWTVFAPPAKVAVFDFVRDERVRNVSAGVTSIEAITRLDEAVYSHLNSFSRVSIAGHRRLGLRFSPCPERTVEVVHSEYPFGAPARLAYLDANGRFRVVQASDAEKGPFATLAEGPLARGQPLAVTLVDIGTPRKDLATIVFRDWSRQLSTELSPTAGWGLPQNALEFGLASSDAASEAYLSLTLSGTSVGRGWDSVGHRAGAYSNRIEVQLGPAAP